VNRADESVQRWQSQPEGWLDVLASDNPAGEKMLNSVPGLIPGNNTDARGHR